MNRADGLEGQMGVVIGAGGGAVGRGFGLNAGSRYVPCPDEGLCGGC